MTSFSRVLCLSGIGCLISASAMAVPAPAPEIGDGIVGTVVAVVALLAVVMFPRVKRMVRAKED
jgi:hypothetical protein